MFKTMFFLRQKGTTSITKCDFGLTEILLGKFLWFQNCNLSTRSYFFLTRCFISRLLFTWVTVFCISLSSALGCLLDKDLWSNSIIFFLQKSNRADLLLDSYLSSVFYIKKVFFKCSNTIQSVLFVINPASWNRAPPKKFSKKWSSSWDMKHLHGDYCRSDLRLSVSNVISVIPVHAGSTESSCTSCSQWSWPVAVRSGRSASGLRLTMCRFMSGTKEPN